MVDFPTHKLRIDAILTNTANYGSLPLLLYQLLVSVQFRSCMLITFWSHAACVGSHAGTDLSCIASCKIVSFDVRAILRNKHLVLQSQVCQST